jgi:hypothetical protein
VKEYIESSKPSFAIGEYWDSLAYENGQVCYNQGAHLPAHLHKGMSHQALGLCAVLSSGVTRLLYPQSSPSTYRALDS